jgi:hypothetical protein
MAAVGLACSASSSRADITKMLPRGEAIQESTPRQVLPAISNPRPFRQTRRVACNVNNALGTNVCLMDFDVVPTGRLLQIDKMNCVGGSISGGAFIFNTQLSSGQLVGLVLPPYDGAAAGVAIGPYYFRVGERPRLASGSTGPTDTAICSMAGTLWQAN